MKNVTIALDDDIHRKARIRAAELGTSLSALVKDYLNSVVAGDVPAVGGVREMQAQFKPAEPAETGPWFINGKWSYTPDGKPRQPGAMRGKFKMADNWDEWLPDELASFEAWPYDDPDFDALPFDPSQLK